MAPSPEELGVEGVEPDTFDLTESQKRELDRRLADLDARPGATMPWEVVKARALARSTAPGRP